MRSRASKALVLGIVFMSATTARADWPALAGPGVTVADSPASPNLIVCAPDGTGGMYAGWVDGRSGASGPQPFVRRIDALGNPQWADGGVAVGTARATFERLAIATDGSGGAILVWRDFRADTAGDLYAQRLHPDGSAAWPANGVAVTNGPLHEKNVAAVGDGAGGVFVAWEDDRSGNREIRVQHLDGGGARTWPAAGVVVSAPGVAFSFRPCLVPDHNAGVIVAWSSYAGPRSSPFAQRLTLAGVPLWNPGGVLLSTSIAGSGPYVVAIASDGAAGIEGGMGMVAVLSDGRAGNSIQQAYAQRVDVDGQVRWAADGVSLSDPSLFVFDFFASGDGAGGGVFGWRTYENNAVNRVYAQRVSAAGAKLWAPLGVNVGTGFDGDNFMNASMVSDGAGGAVFAWNSEREEGKFNVLAQRVAPDGSLMWHPDGLLLAVLEHAVIQVHVVPDGTGGGVAAWLDVQGFIAPNLVGAERANGSGTLGVPGPPRPGASLRGVPSPAHASASAQVRFTLPGPGHARVRLFDTSGRLVRELWDGALAAGEQRVAWDGRDASGARARAGLYFISLETDTGRSSTRWAVVD